MFRGENTHFRQRTKSLLFARWKFLKAREAKSVPGGYNWVGVEGSGGEIGKGGREGEGQGRGGL